ncbi:hypothetical protein DFH07DRAFT_724744, partial [Mycena maculata]
SGDEDSADDAQGRWRQVLVKSKSSWRKVHAKWVIEAREADVDLVSDKEMGPPADSDDEEETDELPAKPPVSGKWLPLMLSKLFGGNAPRPVDPQRPRKATFDREQLLMELLAAEHSDEAPDDGEMEGS